MLLKYQPKIEHLKCVVLTPKEGLELSRNMITLLPGTNEVTDDEWKAMRGNIVAELDSKEIIILAQKVSAGRGKVGGVRAKNLKDMPTNLAVKYVNECNNPDTLKKWYAEITNEEVRLAITKKFKKLELELPEDEIPETPNESPMSLEEFDSEDEEDDEDDDTENLLEDDDTNDDTEGNSEEELEKDFSEMTVNELRAKCEELGIETKKLSKKSDFIEALKNNSDEE